MQRTDASWPDHNQNLSTPNDFTSLYLELIANELRYDAGLKMDTIFVTNGFIPALSVFDGTLTKNGRIIVVTRPNEGGSFAGYDFAVKNFPYDYYLFSEEDLFIGGEDYYRLLLEKFEGMEKAGMVALVGVTKGDKNSVHAHGGVGLTSKKVLHEVFKNGLPHPKGKWDREQAINEGEVPLTNEMAKLGYGLEYYGTNEWTNKNLIMPYFNVRKLYE